VLVSARADGVGSGESCVLVDATRVGGGLVGVVVGVAREPWSVPLFRSPVVAGSVAIELSASGVGVHVGKGVGVLVGILLVALGGAAT